MFTDITCDDSSECTTDTCDAATGCVFTDITCDDSSECTTDTCDAATGCVFTDITCDDSSECTTDSCDVAIGCVYTALDLCAAGAECTDDGSGAFCNCADGQAGADCSIACDTGSLTPLACDASTGADSCANTYDGTRTASWSLSCNDYPNACVAEGIDGCEDAAGCLTDQWVQWDFGAQTALSRIRFVFEWWTKRPQNFAIWVSDAPDATPGDGATLVHSQVAEPYGYRCVADDPCDDADTIPAECCPNGFGDGLVQDTTDVGSTYPKLDVVDLETAFTGRYWYLEVLDSYRDDGSFAVLDVEFTGCPTDGDQCAGVACENGGVCVDQLDAFECACPTGFEGDLCELGEDDCSAADCGQGTCLETVESYRCLCDDGFTGADCSATCTTSQLAPAGCFANAASADCGNLIDGARAPTWNLNCASEPDTCVADGEDGCSNPNGCIRDAYVGLDLGQSSAVSRLRYVSDWHSKSPKNVEVWFSDDPNDVPDAGATYLESYVGQPTPWKCVDGDPCDDEAAIPAECCPNGFGAGLVQDTTNVGANYAKYDVIDLAEYASGRYWFLVVRDTYGGDLGFVSEIELFGCGIDGDQCAEASCANGGTCVDGVDSFTCDCATGYTGSTCTECDAGYQDPDLDGACELIPLFVDPTAAAGGDGSSWEAAYDTIQAAVDAAASTGQAVWAKAGTYTADGADTTVLTMAADVAVYGGFAGALTGTDGTLAGRDTALDASVLSGDWEGDGATVNDADSVVIGAAGATLDGFAVQLGYNDAAAGDALGAGILLDGATGMQIVGCTVSNNTATPIEGDLAAFGAGIYCADSTEVTISDSVIANNTAVGAAGLGSGAISGAGAAAGGGMYLTGCEVTLTGGSFSGNQATGGAGRAGGDTWSGSDGANAFGGGVAMETSSVLDVDGTVFSGNAATAGVGGQGQAPSLSGNGGAGSTGGSAFGGAVYTLDSTLTVASATFQDNTSTGGPGGAGRNGSCAINTQHGGDGGDGGDGSGGAVYAAGGAVDLGVSSVTDNTAAAGDGGNNGNGCSGGDAGSVGSAGIADGGGVYEDGVTVDLDEVTFSGNSPDDVGPVDLACGAGPCGDNSGCDETGATPVCVCDVGYYGDGQDCGLQLFVDAAAGAGGDGTTWETAFATLQDAVDAGASRTVVFVKAGTFTADSANATVVTLAADVALYGGFDPSLTGTDGDVDSRDLATHISTISGDWNDDGATTNDSSVVVVGAPGARLDGFVVAGGYHNTSGSTNPTGSGVELSEADGMVIADCTIRDNVTANSAAFDNTVFQYRSSQALGGGLYCDNSTGVVITDTTFEGNAASGPTASISPGFSTSAKAGNGGGAYLTGCDLTCTRCTFSGNEARGGSGAYDSFSGSALAAADAFGGGIYADASSGVVLDDCTFDSNVAAGGDGGDGGDPLGEGNGNGGTSGGDGFGGAVAGLGSLTFTTGSYTGNTASGGIGGDGSDGTCFTSSKKGGNGASGGDGYGGALYLVSQSAVDLGAITVTGNAAGAGPGGSGGSGCAPISGGSTGADGVAGSAGTAAGGGALGNGATPDDTNATVSGNTPDDIATF